MTESLVLALRVGFSLLIVLGLMWVMARMFRTRLGARGAGTLEVLARQQVGRGASVAILRVADRALVVGVTEHGITLLGEPIADLASLTAPAPATEVSAGNGVESLFAGRRTDGVPTGTPGPGTEGPLGGSVLSPSTWRRTVQLIRDRTVRRG